MPILIFKKSLHVEPNDGVVVESTCTGGFDSIVGFLKSCLADASELIGLESASSAPCAIVRLSSSFRRSIPLLVWEYDRRKSLFAETAEFMVTELPREGNSGIDGSFLRSSSFLGPKSSFFWVFSGVFAEPIEEVSDPKSAVVSSPEEFKPTDPLLVDP